MSSRTIPFFQQAPFIRLTISLCIGIILQWYHPLAIGSIWSVSIVVIVICLLFSFSSLKIKYRYSCLAGAFYMLLFGLLGMILVWIKDIRNDKLWIGKPPSTQPVYLATIINSLTEGHNSRKSIADVNGYFIDGHFYNCKGKILVYFSKTILQPVNAGNQILFKQQLSSISNSNNPETFDYSQYCLFRGITHQVYLNDQNFRVSSDNKKTLSLLIQDLSIKIVDILRHYIHSRKESGLAEAMMIGYKEDLDKELLQSYSDVGVVHIIAISGMHLALIYALLIAVTFPSNPIKKFIWWRALIVLSGIWTFTLITGFQASILRAGIMLSAFVIAKSIFRKTSSLNSLAFSAFILLCCNPFWLWDIGFQLSYLAVAGIFIFYKTVLSCFIFHNKILQSIWKSVALTLSAQLLTTPVTIYYFHQFPKLFLLSNLIAIPLSSLILLFEIILIAFSWWPPIAILLARITYQLIHVLNEFIIRIQKIPNSMWKGLSLSLIQCFTAYILIFCVTAYLHNKSRVLKYAAALSIISICIIRLSSFYGSFRQHKLIVFNIPNHQAVQLVDQRTSLLITNGISRDNFIQSIQPSLIKYRLDVPRISFNKQFQFANRKIVIIDSMMYIRPSNEKMHIDFMIFSTNAPADLKGLLQNFSVEQIILDPSLPYWKEKELTGQCNHLNIPCYDVRIQGAFVRNL